MLMLSAWLLLLELWALEVTAWAALWACYGCRWAYRRNLVGRAVAVFRGRRTVSASHDAYRMAPLPASLAADPYDTERSRTRS
jgi:hypothetical protein